MGTKMAPNYAILFMDYIERKILSTCQTTPLVWWRYIDDIFFIWSRTRKELSSFQRFLNEFHPTIKFTFETSETSIDFLDTTIVKNEDSTLYSKIYNKPTNAFLYLHCQSCHPKHQKENIPFAQALRIRKICTKDLDFENEAIRLISRFLLRGYPEALLIKAINRARDTNREELLKKSATPKNHDLISFVIPNNPHNPPIGQIINKYSHILNNNPETDGIAKSRILITFTKPKSIRNILVKSDIRNTERENTGSRPCGKQCRICTFVKTSSTFSSTKNKRTFKITSLITCQTTCLIYLIQCKKCNKQYVGQTSNSLNTRMRAHLFDITHADENKPVSAHFASNNHNINDVTITGIATAPSDVNKRLRCEESWITILQMKSLWGLNLIS